MSDLKLETPEEIGQYLKRGLEAYSGNFRGYVMRTPVGENSEFKRVMITLPGEEFEYLVNKTGAEVSEEVSCGVIVCRCILDDVVYEAEVESRVVRA